MYPQSKLNRRCHDDNVLRDCLMTAVHISSIKLPLRGQALHIDQQLDNRTGYKLSEKTRTEGLTMVQKAPALEAKLSKNMKYDLE